ncbi:uncharacterized protein BDR25DRAFT_215413 [Lindgomyces ingoldianus]|uniref:Uncharacterized protein n=1 Tax=Lindgomyces ingoldianus TaxID=673940 RepID=A0ACB6R5J1_9PLEO|nr:uncharacterized protein BDR25DRAFT_215413 [Lindgomyces ingoldianus]KAF2474524.1 hypothetical protein BDR25DRAFT_215413 [Lindgomyces ingoldianus]
MSDLGERLERLGLSQYLEVFVAEGFDTWETVLDITESDLNALNVKLGHRRKLQRAIAETRGQAHDRPLPIALGKSTSVDGSYRSDDSAPESKSRQQDVLAPGNTGTSTKRKYRRHPKPDEHAPERPPSAYVIFSNQVRETLKGQEYSFTEIAKVVGERWQILPVVAREACERQANAAKEKYYAELAEYKKTPQYDAYQKYLEDFKAKHAAPQKGMLSNTHLSILIGAEGKRSKIETGTSSSTLSSGLDQAERSRRVGSAQPDHFSMGHHRSESSPPIRLARLPDGHSYGSKSTSPATHSLSGMNSPRVGDLYSPLSASPRSASLHKENSFDLHASALARDSRERHSDPTVPTVSTISFPSSSYSQPQPISSTTPPSATYGSHSHGPVDLPSRRPYWEPTRLPPLTHEDTTLSSESGGGYSSTATYPPPPPPTVDGSKSMRMLPQPVPSIGATPSPLNRPPPVSSAQQPQDFRTSSLAALLRASELARVADDEAVDKESSP